MLEGRYVDENIRKLYYSEQYEPKLSQIYVSLGIARTFNDSFKPYVFIPLKNSLVIGNNKIDDVGITIHNFDPTSAPSNRTLLTMMIPVTNSAFWVKLRKENKVEYDRRKEEIANRMIDEIDTYFGDVKGNVEMIDVATPETYIRYTNNWNGAPCSW